MVTLICIAPAELEGNRPSRLLIVYISHEEINVCAGFYHLQT